MQHIQNRAHNALQNYCWFCDFGAHRRLIHALGLLCPALLSALGLGWLWSHTPVALGDLLWGVCLLPLALLARRAAA